MEQTQILSVSDINKYVKSLFENDPLLPEVSVRGEITNFKAHYTGHLYFTLKDEYSTIKCVMFKGYAQFLKFKPSDGMKVVIKGQVSCYERDGVYQIYAKAMNQDGMGNLYREYEKLKAKLEEEMQRQRILVTKEFNTAVNQSGDSVFVRAKDERYSASTWNFMFGMFNGVFVTDSANSYNSFRYGISADYNYEYFFDTLSVGFDVNADAIILPFTNGDDTILGSFGIVPKFGFTKLSKNLFFRVGFGSILRGTNSDKTTLHETLFSPVFGVGVNNIKLGSIAFSGNYDYYLGHLAYSDLNSAMSAKVNFAIPIGEMQKVKLNLNVGLKDTLLIKADGIENRAGILLAIGAENVIK